MLKKRELAENAGNTNRTNIGEGEREPIAVRENDATAELIREWHRDAEQLKLIVADFSLEEAIRNKAFADALRSGATVFEAYKEMLAMPRPQPMREEIFQNARSARRGTGGATVNPAKLSSEEFKKYIDSIRNN